MNWRDILRSPAGINGDEPAALRVTVLGMIVGVAAVVLMMAVGQVLESVKALDRFDRRNLFIISVPAHRPQAAALRHRLGADVTLSDAAAFAQRGECQRRVARWSWARTAQLVYEAPARSAMVTSATADCSCYCSWASNRAFRNSAMPTSVTANRVALLGPDRGGKAIIPATSIPVLRPSASKPAIHRARRARSQGQSHSTADQDDSVIVRSPLQQQLQNNQFPGSVRQIVVQGALSAQTPWQMPGATLTDLLRQRHRTQESQESDFNIRNLCRRWPRSAADRRAMMSLLLGAIALGLAAGRRHRHRRHHAGIGNQTRTKSASASRLARASATSCASFCWRRC